MVMFGEDGYTGEYKGIKRAMDNDRITVLVKYNHDISGMEAFFISENETRLLMRYSKKEPKGRGKTLWAALKNASDRYEFNGVPLMEPKDNIVLGGVYKNLDGCLVEGIGITINKRGDNQFYASVLTPTKGQGLKAMGGTVERALKVLDKKISEKITGTDHQSQEQLPETKHLR